VNQNCTSFNKPWSILKEYARIFKINFKDCVTEIRQCNVCCELPYINDEAWLRFASCTNTTANPVVLYDIHDLRFIDEHAAPSYYEIDMFFEVVINHTNLALLNPLIADDWALIYVDIFKQIFECKADFPHQNSATLKAITPYRDKKDKDCSIGGVMVTVRFG